MAKLALTLTIFFTAFAISSVFSRTVPLTPKTTLLDVSFENQKAQNVFSSNPEAFEELNQEEKSNPFAHSSSLLSFQLHSRLAIAGADLYNDYESLVLSRIARDSARVSSLRTRVDLVLNGVEKANLEPVEENDSVRPESNRFDSFEVESNGLGAPVVSGMSQGSGEYFARVGIGHPPSQAYMVVDTGSDVSWVQCAPCADCYQQTDPIFEPSASSTYEQLTCKTQQCKSLDVSACRNDTCLYQVSYGDGSYSVGELISETFSFGGSAKVDNIAIGCGHDNEGLFTGAAGLFALGGGSLSFPSQIRATSFSYCLVNRDTPSASTLEFNSATPSDAVTAPLLRNPKMTTYFYIDLTGMSIGGAPVPFPPSSFQLKPNGDGGIIVDSGTAITRLPTEAYNALRDAFVKGTHDLPTTNGVAIFDTCFNLSSRNSVEVPTVSFHFSNGKEWSLPAKNYLVPMDTAGTYCFAFAPASSDLGIIGNVQQQGTRVSFDLANSLIWFSANKC